MADINAVMANAAQAFATQAERCEREAVQLQNNGTALDSNSTYKDIGGPDKRKAQAKQAEAVKLRAQAEAAKKGFLLVDRSDRHFQLKQGALLSAAARAGRVQYYKPPK